MIGHWYVVVLAATTLAYRPNGGELDGPQKDVTPLVGGGYMLTESIALELDVGPTFVDGEYVAFGLTPGVLWLFDPHFYLAGRFIVSVDPEVNLTLVPGAGASYTWGNVTAFAELDLLSTVGKGDPDFGVGLAGGIVYLF